MQVRCTKCGKKRIVSPCELAKSGVTEETYLCINCTRERRKEDCKSRTPDFSQLRKIQEFAKIIEENKKYLNM